TLRLPPRPPLFPSTTLFRSPRLLHVARRGFRCRLPLVLAPCRARRDPSFEGRPVGTLRYRGDPGAVLSRQARPSQGSECADSQRSEEHTSELQSRENLVCRL